MRYEYDYDIRPAYEMTNISGWIGINSMNRKAISYLEIYDSHTLLFRCECTQEVVNMTIESGVFFVEWSRPKFIHVIHDISFLEEQRNVKIPDDEDGYFYSYVNSLLQ